MGPLKSSSVNPSITGKYVGSFAAFFSPGRRPCPDGATKLFRIMLLFVSSPFLRWFRRRREGSTAQRVMGNDFAEHSRVKGRGRGPVRSVAVSNPLVPPFGPPLLQLCTQWDQKKNQVAHVKTLHT